MSSSSSSGKGPSFRLSSQLSLSRNSYNRSQRGSIILVAMIAVTALVGLGGLTILAVRGGLTSTSHDRHKSVALYAAEAGAAIAMEYLRARVEAQPVYWTSVVAQRNLPAAALLPADLPGNQVEPDAAGLHPVFSPNTNAWYEVEILNNEDDPGFDDGPSASNPLGGGDTDGRVFVRVTGHGPNNATAQIEWEIQSTDNLGTRACNSGGETNDGVAVCGVFSRGISIGGIP